MDFILMLHSHLPYVLNHGRWPHGSDWLTEAAIDTYLPLLENLQALDARGTAVPLTIGITPVLANQLASPLFVEELEEFLAQRLAACDEAPTSLATTGDAHLQPLVDYWRARFERLRDLFHRVNGDLVGAFGELERRGVVEIVSSAATHGYLPLLGRDESIRLQLGLGYAEHRRLFGRDPAGCWLPECGYRPRGRWAPLPEAPHPGTRAGIEAHLEWAGFRYFFTDAHLAHAGDALGTYADVPLGAERFDAERHDIPRARVLEVERSPYRAYRAASTTRGPSAICLVRDPRSSLQVWSRQQGYPGDEWYLDFHKIRWPGGLKFWRVSGPNVDLGDKRPYDPARAIERVGSHADHFAHLLSGIAAAQAGSEDAVVVAPFDTELFGHWWYEGVDFVSALFSRLAGSVDVRPVTASDHLAAHPPATVIRLAAGSWGANGDNSMWLNDGTRWMWQRLWPLEDAFWDAVPRALASDTLRPIVAQAARELVLAQSSDWPFIISTGAVANYGADRFNLHVDDATRLIQALAADAPATVREAAQESAAQLSQRDHLFPDILPAVERALVARPAGIG